MFRFYSHKIQHFLILSIFLHLLIFSLFCWICFASLDKNQKILDVFLLTDVRKNTEQTISQKLKNSDIYNLKKVIGTLKSNEEDKLWSEVIEITDQISLLENSNNNVSSHGSYLTSLSHESSEKGFIETDFGNMNGPKFIHKETPIYPQIARKLGKEGRVVLRLTLDDRGNLIDIEILESAPYGFTEAAIEAIKKSKFSPALQNGKPVSCKAILPIRFVLKN